MSTSLSPLDAWLSGENAASDSGQLFWDSDRRGTSRCYFQIGALPQVV